VLLSNKGPLKRERRTNINIMMNAYVNDVRSVPVETMGGTLKGEGEEILAPPRL
jgi:hypothetical protein